MLGRWVSSMIVAVPVTGVTLQVYPAGPRSPSRLVYVL